MGRTPRFASIAHFPRQLFCCPLPYKPYLLVLLWSYISTSLRYCLNLLIPGPDTLQLSSPAFVLATLADFCLALFQPKHQITFLAHPVAVTWASQESKPLCLVLVSLVLEQPAETGISQGKKIPVSPGSSGEEHAHSFHGDGESCRHWSAQSTSEERLQPQFRVKNNQPSSQTQNEPPKPHQTKQNTHIPKTGQK